ncbi:hypothetical protein SDC9_73228 [bioreactor metagenome]|uniref:Uncharacterized protein n=1 Tax=bioreactor metagenome TaxID=1076179 RepID=A0A644YJQ1_9ZZZZ
MQMKEFSLDKDQKKIMTGCVVVVFFVLFLLFPSVWLINMYFSNAGKDRACSYSENVQKSKEKDLFIDYYIPIEDSIIIAANSYRAEKIWCEKQWRTIHKFLGEAGFTLAKGMNIIVPDTVTLGIVMASDDPAENDLQPFTKLNDSLLVYSVPEQHDTIALVFFNRELQRDTVLFVRESLLHGK